MQLRRILPDMVDAVDINATKAVRIAEFRPAVAYMNHLRIFLYIWAMFLPMAIVRTSGWFTVLWSLLITYGVGQLFFISAALNGPFGFDPQDVRLTRMCATAAAQLLGNFTKTVLDPSVVIRADHETPDWLERPLPDSVGRKLARPSIIEHSVSAVRRMSKRTDVVLGLLVYVVWCAGIVFGAWRISFASLPPEGDGDVEAVPVARWWPIFYLPLSSASTTYISLGVFLLLGFWMSDAYSRYWRGLQIWNVNIRPTVEHLAAKTAICFREGLWHQRDRQRILSHLAAFPYALKQQLRQSRDVSDFQHMLDAQDLATIKAAKNMPGCIMHVINGYFNELDARLFHNDFDGNGTLGFVLLNLIGSLAPLESNVGACGIIQKFPMPPAFTTHLQLFTIFWLAVLPLTLVQHDGFVSFLYLVPIGYSIIRLLNVGQELADPFGYDADDIPLDMLCEEMRDAIHNSFLQAQSEKTARYYLRESQYFRETFFPKKVGVKGSVPNIEADDEVAASVMGSIRKFLGHFPGVPVYAQIAAMLWAVAATFLTWGLSNIGYWAADERQAACREWCSPLDVKGDVLANIGFALFMILAFRAADGISRYEEGADVLYGLANDLRVLAVEVVHSMAGDDVHKADKERIIAHLVQFPLCFRDITLGIERTGKGEREGLLSDDDWEAFRRTHWPMDHLLKVIEAYATTNDVPSRDELPGVYETILSGTVALIFTNRIASIRRAMAAVMSVKRFPVIGSYKRHQYLFTALWLLLLPFAITPKAGFFTILWASLISYAVLGLESIAAKLVDPFGDDDTDLPVDGLCTEMAESILEAVHNTDWKADGVVGESLIEEEPQLYYRLKGDKVVNQFSLPQLDTSTGTPSDEQGFKGPREPKIKQSLYAHMLQSVPVGQLVVVTVWTAVACVISYMTRERGVIDERWWRSFISVDVSVGQYVSFASFTVLGFYVSNAFRRYNLAGMVWGDHLRGQTHCVLSQMLPCWKSGDMHNGDFERFVGHLAALPIALKMELRGTRDLRELKGLLSANDVSKIQFSQSMSAQCLNVVRGYYSKLYIYLTTKDGGKIAFSRTGLLLLRNLPDLEKTVQTALFLNNVGIAPEFISLVNLLLGLWFLIIPFVLAEISGWLTVLWVPLIAYGLLGMHRVAAELQNPFGTDLNDLDLDSLADEIVADLLAAYQHHRHGWESVTVDCKDVAEVPSAWKEISVDAVREKWLDLAQARDKMSGIDMLWEGVQLAAQAVPVWLLFLTGAWAAVAVAVSYFISVHLPQPGGNAACTTWFCSAIAVDGAVMQYIGFALFLLLGFRLNDSHARFVQGVSMWRQGIVGEARLLSTRIFSNVTYGVWHEGDMQRIAGHIAGFAICLMGELRDTFYEERLLTVLSPKDVELVKAAHGSAEYCADVVRGYIGVAETFWKQRAGAVGSNELIALFGRVNAYQQLGRDCRRLRRIPLPFGYVQHLRIFLCVWLGLLPLGIVQDCGWVTVLWVVVIAYGMIGTERWADELSDPFGYDVSDVPLEEMCDRVVLAVKGNLELFKHGTGQLITEDRPGFPGEDFA